MLPDPYFPLIFVAGRAAAHQVHRKIMGKPQQKCPLIAHTVQKIRPFQNLAKHLLQHIPRIRLIPHEIQQKRKQRLRVFFVNAFGGIQSESGN